MHSLFFFIDNNKPLLKKIALRLELVMIALVVGFSFQNCSSSQALTQPSINSGIVTK